MTGQKLKLVYFDSPFWRAEVARITMFMGGLDFEDKRLTGEEFAELKPNLPFGQVPVLYIDDKPLAQSGAICRYVGKLAGLYPKDDLSAAKVDEVIDYCGDITQMLSPSLREKDEKKKLEMRAELAKEALPEAFKKLEKLLLANVTTKYFVGKSLTIADLCVWRLMYWITCGTLDGIPKDIAAPFKVLNAFLESVSAHPKVVEWKRMHPKFYQ